MLFECFIVSFSTEINTDALRVLIQFVQSKNREKYPWRGVTFSKF